MKKQSYQRLLAVLISLMILLVAGMAIVAATLLQNPPDAPKTPEVLPDTARTNQPESGELLTAADLAPDPTKWFAVYDGTLTDAQGNPVQLTSLLHQPTVLLFWSSKKAKALPWLFHGGTPLPPRSLRRISAPLVSSYSPSRLILKVSISGAEKERSFVEDSSFVIWSYCLSVRSMCGKRLNITTMRFG